SGPDTSPMAGRNLILLKSRVKLHLTWSKAHGTADKVGRLARTKFTLHTAVLPFDRERPGVADLVERPRDLFEVHAATPGRAEVPAAPRITEIQVTGQDARLAVERRDGVLDVHVVNPIRERANEFHRINTLPVQMAGVEIE